MEVIVGFLRLGLEIPVMAVPTMSSVSKSLLIICASEEENMLTIRVRK